LALLLCGDADGWDAGHLAEMQARYAELLSIHHLVRRAASAAPGVLADERGEGLAQLGVRDAAQYLVRPDGHVGFRCAGRALAELERYLAEWFPQRVSGR